ncbi:translation initiation factor eIF3 subunit [Cutaneotrichosporon oleaginosum]|uniref:Eukaryotic translation initiation factor 3 subunit J n=1 Tax=Cutaneotrichosporon oleaginosum TaxID=879819 RepID=A0A0J0XBU4_9TREE|nr:translation initiation factor eIF3 subunit [Cutaneotrichosporon oleaginosum]KLT38541.1 translation initiation factor eIF3 subunit [Cutaneotrichosporon oleaginosum]
MSDDDWDVDEPSTGTSTPAPVVPRPSQNKWAGEDEEEDDWDVSDSEKKPAPPKKSAVTAAPPKKKMTLKQKLAEKEKLAAEKKARGGEDDLIDERTEQDRRREAREKELEADLAVASDLMGGMEVSTSDALKAALSANPKTKADFTELSTNIVTALIKKHEDNGLFPAFVEQLAKELCGSLSAVQTRKVSSALSVLGNTKQQEERDKASGKKKASTKPKLGATKVLAKVDLDTYDDVLEDDDFM